MHADSVARREQFLKMASDLLRLQGVPEVIEDKDEPRLCLTLVVDGMHCEVFHFEGSRDVVLHCHFALPAHDRVTALRSTLTFNQQVLRTHGGTFAMRRDDGEMVLSAKASMDDTTPEALLQSFQSAARWTPPWATQH